MSLTNYKSVHITLFKEKESFFKRSFNKHILLIFNNLTIFLVFLKIHAQFLNLSLLLTKIFFFSLKLYYKYNIKFNLKFYKHYFFTYFNFFFNKIMKLSTKIKNLINLFFIKFFNKLKIINNNFNKKLFILYNFNIFLIGKNYNVYTGNIIPFYQKKLMWFIGTGLKLDGECSESVLAADEFNKLIWCNFEKNNILKIQNFFINLKGFNIHKRLKHYYYLYLNFTFKYIRLQKFKFLKIVKKKSYFKNNVSDYYYFYKTKTKYFNKIKQIKIFIYNFFINILFSLCFIFKSFYYFFYLENKKINLFFYFLNSFFIYLKSIILFMKLLQSFNLYKIKIKTNLFEIIKKFYSLNILNLYFFNNLFENKKLYFLFFNFFIKKKQFLKKYKKFNYLKLLNRKAVINYILQNKINKRKTKKISFIQNFKNLKFNLFFLKKYKLKYLKRIKLLKIKKLKLKNKKKQNKYNYLMLKKFRFYLWKKKKRLKKNKKRRCLHLKIRKHKYKLLSKTKKKRYFFLKKKLLLKLKTLKILLKKNLNYNKKKNYLFLVYFIKMLKQKKKNYFMNKYMFNNFKILKKFKWLLMKYRSRKFYKKFFFFENFNKNRLIYDKDEYYKKDKYFSLKKKHKLLKKKKFRVKKFIIKKFKKIKKLKFFMILNKKILFINNILNKRYLNLILISLTNKYIQFKKFSLLVFNTLYFLKTFSIFSFLFKINYFFIKFFIKKYEFFIYYKNFMNFNETLEDLNKFNNLFKVNKYNFIFMYKIIFEKILILENNLKQFVLNLLKFKTNCFKYKYFFFNIIKYLIILKKKYLYSTTLDLFLKIINKNYLLSEKFNTKIMSLSVLNKKCLLTLKKKKKKKHTVFLMKKKTKKFFGYVLRNLRKYKKQKLKLNSYKI